MNRSGPPQPSVVLDTSAFLDLFARRTERNGPWKRGLVRELELLAPLERFLSSSAQILEEVRRHLMIAHELERHVRFEDVPAEEVEALAEGEGTRIPDLSLVALSLRLEQTGRKVFLVTKDRTFARDLVRARSRAQVVVPTGFAEALTVLARPGRAAEMAYRIQDNAYENISRALRWAREDQGDGSYRVWQVFLDSTTPAKHDLVECLRATGIRL